MSRYTNHYGENYFTIKDEKAFKIFLDETEFKFLLHVEQPKEIGDKWTVRFGYKDYSTDINHFDSDDVLYWWENLSKQVEEPIDFLCTDEEFPIVNEKGFAWRLYCENGKCKITGLKLIESVEDVNAE